MPALIEAIRVSVAKGRINGDLERMALLLTDKCLADCIAADLIERFPIERVTVSVHKPHAPIRAAFGDVIVTVTRTA